MYRDFLFPHINCHSIVPDLIPGRETKLVYHIEGDIQEKEVACRISFQGGRSLVIYAVS
jgi:hypothetical protein